jgi:AAA family ATP:ADP antiporter
MQAVAGSVILALMERARERAASIAVLTSIPMVAQLVAARAVRDTVFLSEYEASYLPRAMLASAVFSLAAAVSVSRAMPRWGPRGTAATLAAVNGSLFIVEAAMIQVAPGAIAVLAYIHVSVVGALVVSAFSSVVNERFDPHFAKTVVSQVGIGATLGGVLGGLLALVLSDVLGLATMLYGLGALSALVGIGVWNVGKPNEPQMTSEDKSQSGVQAIRKDPYLSRVGLTVMLLGIVGVLVDYAMKAEADARFDDSASLLSFFAVFYMCTALLTFIVQAGVAKPLLQRLGLGRTMAILPIAVALSAGIGAVWTRLWTAALARGSQTVLSSSLFRSGYELLYTPIPPLKKRGTKAVIDIASNRIGYGIGSAIVMLIVMVAAAPKVATAWVLVVAVAASVVAAWMIRQLQDGYVKQLAASLRDGSIALRSSDIVDATTLHTVAETATLSREAVLRGIAELGRRDETGSGFARQRDTWTTQLSDLLSDDPNRVLDALSDESLTPRLAGPVIDLLAKDPYAQPAYAALERMGAQIMGQLVDAMLFGDNPVEVRRRIPRLLRKLEEPRAISGLSEGLEDDELEVRKRCGLALVDLRRANRDLVFPRSAILDAIVRELDLLDSRSGAREEDETLKHVFNLLSVVLDPDAMSLSLRALSSEDQNLRGTALEYLHNVLPEAIREPLWPRLAERSSRPPVRPATQAPEELLRSMQSLMLNRDQLEK